MRTTLTLDDDIAARLQAEARRTARSFKEVVNELLRAALAQRRAMAKVEPFVVQTIQFGGLHPGLSVDKIGALIEQLEGSVHR